MGSEEHKKGPPPDGGEDQDFAVHNFLLQRPYGRFRRPLELRDAHELLYAGGRGEEVEASMEGQGQMRGMSKFFALRASPPGHPELVLACLLACLPACLPACLLTVRGPELVPKVFILGPVGAVLGLLWGPLGGLLGPCWGSLVPSWALLGSQWQQTRVAPISLAPLRGRKVAFRRRLGPS